MGGGGGGGHGCEGAWGSRLGGIRTYFRPRPRKGRKAQRRKKLPPALLEKKSLLPPHANQRKDDRRPEGGRKEARRLAVLTGGKRTEPTLPKEKRPQGKLACRTGQEKSARDKTQAHFVPAPKKITKKKGTATGGGRRQLRGQGRGLPRRGGEEKKIKRRPRTTETLERTAANGKWKGEISNRLTHARTSTEKGHRTAEKKTTRGRRSPNHGSVEKRMAAGPGKPVTWEERTTGKPGHGGERGPNWPAQKGGSLQPVEHHLEWQGKKGKKRGLLWHESQFTVKSQGKGENGMMPLPEKGGKTGT